MPDTSGTLSRRYRSFAKFTGALAALAGTLVLFGWWLNIDVLMSLAPGLVSMKANTALCFILTGTSLWLKCIDAPSRAIHAARILAAVAASIGLLTLIEYLAVINLGIDELLFLDPNTLVQNSPGRMAPATAANFLLLGSALALDGRNLAHAVAELFSLIVLVSGLIAVLGYLYGVEALYRIGAYTSMALHTALLFTALACASLASQPERGIMRALTSPLAGGGATRRILPWIVFLTVFLGWLQLAGQREGLYGTEFGLALFAVSNIAVLACVVYFSACALSGSDAALRKQHEREQHAGRQLRVSNERWRLAATNAGLGTWHWNPGTGDFEWSGQRYALCGVAPGTPVTFETFLAQVHPDDRARVQEALQLAKEQNSDYSCEYRIVLPDGGERWIASWGCADFDARRQAKGINGVALDITERKFAEQLVLCQNTVLRLVAAGSALPDTLATMLRLVEAQSPGLLTSISLLDGSGTRLTHGAAPSLPPEYYQALDGVLIGPSAGSCGTAAYRREAVTVTDIHTDPLWADGRELAERFGLRACWSTPVIGANGRLLGTFAMHYRRPMTPGPQHMKLIEFATQTAILAIEHQYALDAIRASEARYRTLGDNSPDVIARYDRELRVLYANRAIEAAIGVPSEKLQRKSFAEPAMPQPQAELWKNTLRQVFETGNTERVEFNHPGPDGTRHWECIAAAERNLRGEIESVLTISRDITARKLAEEERDYLEAQLRQSHKLKALGTLAGGIAHDFNNMLMAISGNAALAHAKIPANHAVHGYLGEIEKAGMRASELVKRILTFSRPSESQHKPVQLQPVIQEALQLLRATVPTTIQIRAYYDPGSSNVMADATQVHQAFMNLATNAAHAMSEHGGTLEVRVEILRVDAALARTSPDLHEGRYERVTVTDNGTGMDAATLERIFDPFFTTKRAGEGTGLGLSVAHGIMRGHGGAITVTSRPGKGTVFCLYFPAGAQSQPGNTSPTRAVVASGGRQRVLFVDDEDSLVLLITRVLEQQNFQVTGATDPRAALTMFASRPQDFDVLVTDLAMPGLSGFDLAREVLKIRPDLPIVITTGYVRPEDNEVARGLGIEHLILKPNTITALGTTLQQLFKTPVDSSRNITA